MYINEPVHDKNQHNELCLCCQHEETLGPQLHIECTAKTLIRLGAQVVCFVVQRLNCHCPTSVFHMQFWRITHPGTQ